MNKSVAYPLGCANILIFKLLQTPYEGVTQIIHKLYYTFLS